MRVLRDVHRGRDERGDHGGHGRLRPRRGRREPRGTAHRRRTDRATGLRSPPRASPRRPPAPPGSPHRSRSAFPANLGPRRPWPWGRQRSRVWRDDGHGRRGDHGGDDRAAHRLRTTRPRGPLRTRRARAARCRCLRWTQRCGATRARPLRRAQRRRAAPRSGSPRRRRLVSSRHPPQQRDRSRAARPRARRGGGRDLRAGHAAGAHRARRGGVEGERVPSSGAGGLGKRRVAEARPMSAAARFSTVGASVSTGRTGGSGARGAVVVVVVRSFRLRAGSEARRQLVPEGALIHHDDKVPCNVRATPVRGRARGASSLARRHLRATPEGGNGGSPSGAARRIPDSARGKGRSAQKAREHATRASARNRRAHLLGGAGRSCAVLR